MHFVSWFGVRLALCVAGVLAGELAAVFWVWCGDLAGGLAGDLAGDVAAVVWKDAVGYRVRSCGRLLYVMRACLFWTL